MEEVVSAIGQAGRATQQNAAPVQQRAAAAGRLKAQARPPAEAAFRLR
jgi:methyl-accepting chemotaxis protein